MDTLKAKSLRIGYGLIGLSLVKDRVDSPVAKQIIEDRMEAMKAYQELIHTPIIRANCYTV